MSFERSLKSAAESSLSTVTAAFWMPVIPCALLALLGGLGVTGAGAASTRYGMFVMGTLTLPVLAWSLVRLFRHPMRPPLLALVAGEAELLFAALTVTGVLAMTPGPYLLATGLAAAVAGALMPLLLRGWKRAAILSLLPASVRPVQLLIDEKRFEDALAVLDRIERMPPADLEGRDLEAACSGLRVRALVALGRLEAAGAFLRDQARRNVRAFGWELVNLALDHQRTELYPDAAVAAAAIEGDLCAAGVPRESVDVLVGAAREELRRRMNGERPRTNPLNPGAAPHRPLGSVRSPLAIFLLVLATLVAAGVITLLVMSAQIDPWKAP